MRFRLLSRLNPVARSSKGRGKVGRRKKRCRNEAGRKSSSGAALSLRARGEIHESINGAWGGLRDTRNGNVHGQSRPWPDSYAIIEQGDRTDTFHQDMDAPRHPSRQGRRRRNEIQNQDEALSGSQVESSKVNLSGACHAIRCGGSKKTAGSLKPSAARKRARYFPKNPRSTMARHCSPGC